MKRPRASLASLVQETSSPSSLQITLNQEPQRNGLSPQLQFGLGDLQEVSTVEEPATKLNTGSVPKDVAHRLPTTGQDEILELKRNKLELISQLEMLQKQVDSRFETVATLRKSIVRTKMRRNQLDDYRDIASKCQVEVRNILNQIYNPGEQVALQVRPLIEERRKDHAQKFEKLSFEMNQLIETTREAIRKKMESLKHENELHQRTIMTLGYQKIAEEEKKLEKDLKDREERGKIEQSADNETDKVSTDALETADGACKASEDDCIIIDDQYSDQTGLCHDSVQTPDNDGLFGSECGKNQQNDDLATATNQFDDETTDIEEQCEDDDEGDDGEDSFTPCQAQRPN